jgi:hypothetical protein
LFNSKKGKWDTFNHSAQGWSPSDLIHVLSNKKKLEKICTAFVPHARYKANLTPDALSPWSINSPRSVESQPRLTTTGEHISKRLLKSKTSPVHRSKGCKVRGAVEMCERVKQVTDALVPGSGQFFRLKYVESRSSQGFRDNQMRAKGSLPGHLIGPAFPQWMLCRPHVRSCTPGNSLF